MAVPLSWALSRRASFQGHRMVQSDSDVHSLEEGWEGKLEPVCGRLEVAGQAAPPFSRYQQGAGQGAHLGTDGLVLSPDLSENE